MKDIIVHIVSKIFEPAMRIKWSLLDVLERREKQHIPSTLSKPDFTWKYYIKCIFCLASTYYRSCCFLFSRLSKNLCMAHQISSKYRIREMFDPLIGCDLRRRSHIPESNHCVIIILFWWLCTNNNLGWSKRRENVKDF